MVKNDVLLSMNYLILTMLFDHAVAVYTCEMFCFTGMIHVLCKFVLILPGKYSSPHKKTKCDKVCIFS